MKCNINFNHNIMDYDFCATIHMTSEEYELLNRAYQEYREKAQNDYLGIRAICEWVEEKNDSDMAERFLELMGFNYVFPTSGQQISPNLPFCSVLARSFRLTKPVFIHEYSSVYKCECFLLSDAHLRSVDI